MIQIRKFQESSAPPLGGSNIRVFIHVYLFFSLFVFHAFRVLVILCSGFQYSGFQYSGVPAFRRSGVPAFRRSGVLAFQRSGVPAFRRSWFQYKPLPARSNGRNGGNRKSCTSEFKDEIVPLTEKEIENLTISALKDELGKRKLSKKGNKQILVSRLKSSLQSTSQKTSAVSDQSDTLLCTVRDEISYPVNCPCLPFLLDLQNEVKEIKANSSRQLQPNPSINCELTKLLQENNALVEE